MSKVRFLILLNLIFFSYLEAHELNPARLSLEEKDINSLKTGMLKSTPWKL